MPTFDFLVNSKIQLHCQSNILLDKSWMLCEKKFREYVIWCSFFTDFSNKVHIAKVIYCSGKVNNLFIHFELQWMENCRYQCLAVQGRYKVVLSISMYRFQAKYFCIVDPNNLDVQYNMNLFWLFIFAIAYIYLMNALYVHIKYSYTFSSADFVQYCHSVIIIGKKYEQAKVYNRILITIWILLCIWYNPRIWP